MIHTYEALPLSKWYSTDTFKNFQKDLPFPSGSQIFPWTYKEMRDSIPFEKFANDPDVSGIRVISESCAIGSGRAARRPRKSLVLPVSDAVAGPRAD